MNLYSDFLRKTIILLDGYSSSVVLFVSCKALYQKPLMNPYEDLGAI